MRNPDKEAPDFVNADGVKWWHEYSTTQYAMRKGLLGCRGWVVEKPDGTKTRLFTKDGVILADDPSLEGIGLKIDILSFQKRTKPHTKAA